MPNKRLPKKARASKGPAISKSKKADASSCSPTFIVEKITGARYKNGRAEMKVKWAGFRPETSTWEPLDNLHNCMVLVSEFQDELSRTIQMANKRCDLHANSGSKKKVDKKTSATKESPAPAPGERQLETGESKKSKSSAKQASTPQPNAGPNIGGNQNEKIPIKLLPALHLHVSDDEPPSSSFGKCASPTLEDLELSSDSDTSNTSKNAQRKQTPQSQAKQNMTTFDALLNPLENPLPQAKAFTIVKQDYSISETSEKPIETVLSDMHSDTENRPEVRTKVQASKKSKKSAKKIQKEESSDDDSVSPLMTPYPSVFGLARGLELDKVVHSFRLGDRHFLFVTWKGIDVVDTVPMEDLIELYPAKVLQYFQKMERRY